MVIPELIILLVGLAATIRGADWVGSSCIELARKYEISQFVIGATLVSFATTLPELSIATTAGIFGKNPTLALGTVLGSSLTILGIILGCLFFFFKERPKLGFFSRAINIYLSTCVILFLWSFYQPFGGSISWLLIIFGLIFLSMEVFLGQHSISLFEE